MVDELFFVAADTLMAVSVKLEPRFSAGLPQPLFTAAKVGLDRRTRCTQQQPQ